MEGSVRRALISVYDKTGVADFAKALSAMGVEIISSGGTAKAIADAGAPVRQLKEWTGFPEMLGHRVVSLHPKVHGGILALRDDPQHQADIKKYGIEPIDLVCVGLYPFEQAIAKPGCTLAEAVEMIDIGGPTMVRAAAKNHRYVTVVTSPQQYACVLDEMRNNDGRVSHELRSRLALAAFSLTAHYDSAINAYLAAVQGNNFPDLLTLSYQKLADLRYGENPHQSASFYRSAATGEPCVGDCRFLGGKEMSFNNYFDANGAFELVKDFSEPAVAIIKHANPAGCAVSTDLVDAYRKAYLGDVNAAMGGIVAVNRPVTAELAGAITESYQRWGKLAGAGGFFAEVVIAPEFEQQALQIITAREGWGKAVRLLACGQITPQRNSEKSLKYVVGGLLVQDRDLTALNEQQWKVVTDRKPTEKEMDDLRFTWLVCKHVKSNAIVLAKDRTLLGAGAGQMSRVNSASMAVHLAKQYGGTGTVAPAGSVVASDAFFPFPDGLDVAAEVGATAVIQPGGAKKDADVIARANELDLAMVFTGTRHFNH
ncbi:MAG: bifunctional phosphoribosylaminoimidazolecarboxamide formyltransferase/IMP cyclohydrolase [Planctomycetes bacterium]|nr:bifunctional phosphoribosylaminoimidazolecarboxamide formyltransferase/IMP cyclohydrolase [Planctomycetota bacterium]